MHYFGFPLGFLFGVSGSNFIIHNKACMSVTCHCSRQLPAVQSSYYGRSAALGNVEGAYDVNLRPLPLGTEPKLRFCLDVLMNRSQCVVDML